MHKIITKAMYEVGILIIIKINNNLYHHPRTQIATLNTKYIHYTYYKHNIHRICFLVQVEWLFLIHDSVYYFLSIFMESKKKKKKSSGL